MGGTQQQIPNKYAALAQVYYWLQIYETNKNVSWEQIIANTISDNFTLYNIDGTWKGKEGYILRLGLLKKWENTHHVKKATVKKNPQSNGCIVDLECTYQCVLPDFTSESYNIIHHIQLESRENELPLISSVQVEILEKLDNTKFNSAYKHNRAISFMYKLLYCIETYKADLTQYNYLFKPGFKSQINSDTLFTASEELSKWLQNNTTQKTFGETQLQNIEVVEVNKNVANVQFDVCQIPIDLSKQIHTTRYVCTIEYCPNDPFAKIAVIKITNKTNISLSKSSKKSIISSFLT